MALLGIEQGIQAFLEPYLLHNATPAGDLKLHLYTNNHAPTIGDTFANYTECTDPGYSVTALTGANWSFSNVGGVSTASFPMITWTFVGAVTIYGYYVTDAATSKLCWAEKFATQLSLGAGQSLNLTPQLTLQ